MSPKTREGKPFSRQPLNVGQDIKTILYSIIFHRAAQPQRVAAGRASEDSSVSPA